MPEAKTLNAVCFLAQKRLWAAGDAVPYTSSRGTNGCRNFAAGNRPCPLSVLWTANVVGRSVRKARS